MKKIKITLPVTPMGKPRMTKRDKWAKRKCVQNYWRYKDDICKHLKTHPELLDYLDRDEVVGVSWTAFFPFPKSYSKKRKASLSGEFHRIKPDRDNIDKGILDAILKDDSGVAFGSTEKMWDDGKGARIVIEFFAVNKK